MVFHMIVEHVSVLSTLLRHFISSRSNIECVMIVLFVILPLIHVIHTIAIHLHFNIRHSSSNNRLVWSFIPFVRNGVEFGRDPNKYLLACKKSYGSVFTLNLAGRYVTFITDARCYSTIVKSSSLLSFTPIAAHVSEKVLGASHEDATNEETDRRSHQHYAKFLTGQHLDRMTNTYRHEIQRWYGMYIEREFQQQQEEHTHQRLHKPNHRENECVKRNGGNGKNSTNGGDSDNYTETSNTIASTTTSTTTTTRRIKLLELMTRSLFSASTRALYGDLLLVDRDANGEKNGDDSISNSSSFTDDFYSPSTLLSDFHSFDDVFPLLYGEIPHFAIRKGVEARNRLIDILCELRSNACEFLVDREKRLVNACEQPPQPHHPHESHDQQSNDESSDSSSTKLLTRRSFGSSQLGMLWALHGNTIPAAFWVIYYLTQNRHFLVRIIDEIRRVLGSGRVNGGDANAHSGEGDGDDDDEVLLPLDTPFDRDALKSLVLLDAAISESLRLSSGSMMMRRVTQDFTFELPHIGSLQLRSNDNIAIFPFLTHHDESIYPQPEVFDIERWINHKNSTNASTSASDSSSTTDTKSSSSSFSSSLPSSSVFLAFGGGVSMCPGRHFARNELKIAIITFLSLFIINDNHHNSSISPPTHLLSRAGLGIYPPMNDIEIDVTLRKVKETRKNNTKDTKSA